MNMKIRIPKMSELDILVALVIISTVSLRNFTYLIYFIQIIFILFSAFFFIKKVDKNYLFIMGAFVFFAFLSALWAKSSDMVIKVVPSLIQTYVICTLLTGYISSKERMEKIISIFIVASIVLIINVLLSTSSQEWHDIIYYSSGDYVDISSADNRMGYSVGMHPNAFSSTITILVFCCFYRLYSRKNIFYLIWGMLLFSTLFFTKSRSSFIEVVIGIGVIYYFQQKRSLKKLRIFIIAIVATIGAFWALMNIPVLYNIAGYRMASLFYLFEAGKHTDSSILARFSFFRIAMILFKSSPIIGVGMNNFAYIAYRSYGIWGETYAHNNYAEILADLGLIGFILYYLMLYAAGNRLRIVLKKLKNNDHDNLYSVAAFLFAVFCVGIVMEFTHITYDREIMQFMYITIICGSKYLSALQKSS